MKKILTLLTVALVWASSTVNAQLVDASQTMRSNDACRDRLYVQGKNKLALEEARAWAKAQPGTASSVCLGLTLVAMGEFREADRVLATISDIAMKEAAVQGDYFSARYNVASALGRSKASLEFARQSLATFREAKLSNYVANALTDVVVASADLEQKDDAEDLMVEAQALCKADWCQASILVTQAVLAPEYKPSIALARKALAIFEKLEDDLGIAVSYSLIADFQLHLRQYTAADKSLALMDKANARVGSRGMQADGLRIRADLARRRAQEKDARALYEKALMLAREIGDNGIAKAALRGMNELD